MKVGILGGTFDPIHNGHLYLAEEALHILALDKIVFMPSGNPPHKKGKSITDGSLRYEMVNAAIRDNEKFFVSSYEIDKNGFSYTYETLEYMKMSLNKDDEMYFITGADCLDQIYKWKNIDRIFNVCKFVVFYRPGFSVESLMEKKKKVEEQFKTEIIFLHLLELNISSTYIREKVRQGYNLSYIIPPSVNYIIKELNLYI